MSSTLLEVTRSAQEDVERIERLIVKELQRDPISNRDQLFQSHRVRSMIDTIITTTHKLVEVYEDEDNARKEEIAVLGGQTATGVNLFGVFYDRLKEIREYHRRHPLARVIDPTEEFEDLLKEEPHIEFSGETYISTERRKMTDLEVKATHSQKKKSKKRVKEDLDCSTGEKYVNNAGEMHELDAELDMSEPTMAEKLASLELFNDDEAKKAAEKEVPLSTNIPSVDSVHVLLKQAIHAQDHALLVDCLSTTDEKVITKSTALLNPSDVLKLLKSLLSMIELRGTVLIRAVPWLKSLITQHASSIASQESSLLVLNSLYQLIESRTSTYQSALQLSTYVDCLFAEIPEVEESASPIIYEDKDSDEDEDSDNTMEFDEESEGLGAVIDSYESDIMSD